MDRPSRHRHRYSRKSILLRLQIPNHIAHIRVQRGKVLHKIQEDGNTVTAIFTDGTQETGDLLIGAEGAHSLTREYLVGKEEAQLIPSEVVASFSLTKLDKEISLSLRNVHPRYCVLFHPNGTFAFYSGEFLHSPPIPIFVDHSFILADRNACAPL